MNRLTACFSTVCAVTLFSSAALAEDAAPAATAAAAKAASTTPASQRAPAQSAASPLQVSTGHGPQVRRLVCLNMSLRCFSVTAQPDASGHTKSLDLRAPDIRTLVSEAELREPLQDPYEMREAEEQVQVEGTRPDIYIAPGLASLPWAIMNPTQAWRIFLPVPASQTK